METIKWTQVGITCKMRHLQQRPHIGGAKVMGIPWCTIRMLEEMIWSSEKSIQIERSSKTMQQFTQTKTRSGSISHNNIGSNGLAGLSLRQELCQHNSSTHRENQDRSIRWLQDRESAQVRENSSKACNQPNQAIKLAVAT